MKLARTKLNALTALVVATASLSGALPATSAAAAGICITAVVLPHAQQSSAYQGLVTTSASGLVRFTMTATGLPPGLTMSSTGLITGTPTGVGTYHVHFSLGTLGCGIKTLPLTVSADQGAVGTFWGAEREVASDVPTDIPGMTDVTGVSTEQEISLFLKANGTVWSWSSWSTAAGGDVPVASAPAPVQVAGLTGITQVAGSGQRADRYALALRYDGTVWIWGTTLTHVTPQGGWATTTYATPTPVPGLKNVVAIDTSNDYMYALTSDGTVWGWGFNNDNQLGATAPEFVTTPAPVPGMTNMTAISADAEIGYGLRSDGTVLAVGALVGAAFNLPSQPASDSVQVPGLTGVTALAAGENTEHAIAGGRVWSWGNDDEGSIGNGTETSYVQTPTVATGLTGVTAIGADPFSTYAIVGSSMYSWGGSLANGSFRSTTPVLSTVTWPIAISGDAAIHLAHYKP